jgi:hypothetical protein
MAKMFPRNRPAPVPTSTCKAADTTKEEPCDEIHGISPFTNHFMNYSLEHLHEKIH